MSSKFRTDARPPKHCASWLPIITRPKIYQESCNIPARAAYKGDMSKLKTLFMLCAAAVMLTGTVSAADLSGKWSGTVTAKTPDGETNNETAWVALTQSGSALTGTAGPSEDKQSPITEGKVNGDQVEFKVQVEDNVAIVKLTLVGDTLKGQAVIETQDGKVTAELNLKRVS